MQQVLVCQPSQNTVAPCPSGSEPVVVQAELLVSSVPTPEQAMSSFDMGLTLVLGTYLIAWPIGQAIKFASKHLMH